ncbi:DeoR/GlpR family DNA-binding transcription regulator [Alkalibacillus almallahensis]|uniref:DeoR/GlpR family DNA-binding transcription regulator n=1 Tax=Alkalibacillus almallahensis TaxID=1379154 RepID=UPI0014231FC8|nr:DeoR/GlpR family DNA-binding transcription regulator [Alkalibacillus almallahensis]NIK13294.1 DeoR/GlpR family transcriptional regulator of sugar metabolism [Alkalibacillus almallahensis]
MLQLERQNMIYELIKTNGKITIDELVSQFSVSSMTVRRDLAALEDEGKLVRTHGGAVSTSLTLEDPLTVKETKYIDEKRDIAQYAMKFVFPNAKIILDSGTTTLELAKLIKYRDDLTIVTNDVKIAHELLDSNSEVILTGGNIQSKVGTLIGNQVMDFYRSIDVDLLFLGANALDLDKGISVPTLEKAQQKQLMIESALKVWTLIDHSKFNKRAFAHVSSLNYITGVITDEGIDHFTNEKLSSLTDLHIANSQKE